MLKIERLENQIILKSLGARKPKGPKQDNQAKSRQRSHMPEG